MHYNKVVGFRLFRSELHRTFISMVLFKNEQLHIPGVQQKPHRRSARQHRLSHRMCILPVLTAAAVWICACGSSSRQTPADIDYSIPGERDSTPRLLLPEQSGSESEGTILGNEEVKIDISHMADGYVSVLYTGDSGKVKLRMTTEDGNVYSYALSLDGEYDVFPLSSGDGSYILGVYTNIEGTMYAEVFSTELQVQLDDEFGPFLYPNQYCWFDENTSAVAESAYICTPANNDLDAVSLAYNYVVSKITYDWEEAENVQSGYLPEIDEILETGKGICLDYSSLLACMLRAQGIPTRMEIGYAGTAYHAWISCYITDVGWVNGLIEFDGKEWSMMDATFAASQGEKKLKKFIGDGENYKTVFLY